MKIKARVVGRTKIDPDQRVVFDHVRVHRQDYSSQIISTFGAVGSRFQECSFKDMHLNNAHFGSGREMSEYIECNFDGLHFDHGGGNARFVKCTFRDVYIREWLCQTTELIECTFSGRLNWAVFCGRIPIEEARRTLHRERNEFRGNDFSQTQFSEPDFRGGIDLSQQRLPSGPEYLYIADAASTVARLQSGLDRWNANPEVRRAALIIAETLTMIVKEGQRQLFLRPESYYRMSEDTFQCEALDKVLDFFAVKAWPTPG